MSQIPACLATFALAAGWGLALDPAGNLTGTWKLNVERSRWGQMKKPHSVVLIIDHKEPALHYTGSILYDNEDVREFAFGGAIDGKEYPMTRSVGNGQVVLRRITPNRFESTFRSNDGLSVETTSTTLSSDGRTLTRQLRLQTPESTRSWTEVYERH